MTAKEPSNQVMICLPIVPELILTTKDVLRGKKTRQNVSGDGMILLFTFSLDDNTVRVVNTQILLLHMSW